jgi:hypothetical protein
VSALVAIVSCGGVVDRSSPGEGGDATATGFGATNGSGASGGIAANGGAGGGSGGTVSASGGMGMGGSGGSGGAACSNLLSNPEHCGRCGHSCLGGVCASGICQPVVLTQLENPGATALALDSTDVYWASPIHRMHKDGSSVTTLADARSGVWGIAVDEEHVYWTLVDGGLSRITKSGGTPQSFGPGGYRVVLDATEVFTAWNGVWRIAKSDGSQTKLADIGGQGIALDDAYVYFTNWISPGGVFRVPKAGGALQQLASADYSSYVAVYAGTVYWSDQGDGSVKAVPTAGGAVTTLATGSTPYGIAADTRGVYWADFATGSIWMLPVGSDSPIELATGQFYPRDLTIDDVAVYWTNDPSQSAVSRVAKPAVP